MSDVGITGSPDKADAQRQPRPNVYRLWCVWLVPSRSSGRHSRGRGGVMTSQDLYRILLKVYPARYRRKYEQAMTQCFRDQLRAADTGGKRVRLGFRTIADFALNAPARHFDPGPITLYRNAYS